jgi:steroid delta-isomerase-like uncharacterized protein
MPAQATLLSPQQIIDAAKAPLIGYNDKNWAAVRASITPNFVYDEVATYRRAEGADQVIELWQGWGKALPDSRCTFGTAVASGNTVVLELTWHGTHSGPLETPNGAIPATGKPIEIRSCFVCEVEGEKARMHRHYFDMATLLRQIGVGG